MNASWSFEDLALQIDRGPSGLITRLVTSPYGPATAPFVPPPWLGDLRARRRSIALQRGAARSLAPAQDEDARALDPVAIGSALFEALFHAGNYEVLLKSLGNAEAQERRGLRMRLSFGPDPEAASFARLPWELLYRRETREFFGLHPETPVVRYLPVPKHVSAEPASEVLRVLVAIASPVDLPRLDLEREVAELRALAGTGSQLEVRFLSRPTLVELREALLYQPCDVFHFMGHGDLDPESGEGLLFFEDASRCALPVPARTLAECLRTSRRPRMAILNACQSAELPRPEGADPFTGVASALLMAGLPAVVAMQYPISDGAAVAFSRAFYRALAAAEPAEAAVSEGRLAIHLAQPTSFEWITPVLFLGVREGNMLTREPTADRSSQSLDRSPQPQDPSPQPQEIGTHGVVADRGGAAAGEGGFAFSGNTFQGEVNFGPTRRQKS